MGKMFLNLSYMSLFSEEMKSSMKSQRPETMHLVKQESTAWSMYILSLKIWALLELR